MWGQIHLQDAGNPVGFYLSAFHDFSLVVMVMVTCYASLSVFTSFYRNSPINKGLQANHLLELIWTFSPMVVLVTVAIPSLALLFLLEDTSKESMPVKVMGSQWFWSYEQPKSDKVEMPYKFDAVEMDSYMVPQDSELSYMYRLLDTSSVLHLNSSMNYTFMITSMDVLHSWAIPSLGIKMDACPGRLNYSFLSSNPLQEGEYFGQCSELCGSNHSFMPISLTLSPNVSEAAKEVIVINPKVFNHITKYLLSSLTWSWSVL